MVLVSRVGEMVCRAPPSTLHCVKQKATSVTVQTHYTQMKKKNQTFGWILAVVLDHTCARTTRDGLLSRRRGFPTLPSELLRRER